MRLGMISTGLGQMNGYSLLRQGRVPSLVAVARNVFLVAITALVASTGHFAKFIQTGGETLSTVMSLVLFILVAAVMIGEIVL